MLLLLLLLYCVSPAMGNKVNKNKLFPEYGINLDISARLRMDLIEYWL